MVGRATAMLDLATRLTRKDARALLDQNKAAVRNDLRRLAIVVAVAALDTYMHRLIVSRAYQQDPMPQKLANLTIRFGDLIAQADAAVTANREGRRTRPRVPAKRMLRERLLRETFQRYERVSEALAMAGRPQSWSDIAAAMPGEPSTEEVRERLNELVERRNAIVHEGDYERLDRPQYAKVTPVSASDARRAVSFVRNLIDAIHELTAPA